MIYSRRSFIHSTAVGTLSSLAIWNSVYKSYDLTDMPTRKNDTINMKKVTFKNRELDIAANIHFPKDFDTTKKYAAVVCVHPGSSVKEQTAGLYAAKLAENGFIAIAYDASYQGESAGEPRYLEDPASRVEDIRCAVDYLITLAYVDENRIGLLGICAGGGYAANAALTERRIMALATVSATSASRAFGELDALKTLEAVGAQRTAKARGAQPLIIPWTPASAQDAKDQGLDEFDMLGAINYYRTPRGQYPTSNNKLLFTSISALVVFDAFHLAERYLTQPLLIIVGDKVGAFGSYRDGFTLYNKAASTQKTIHVVKGASHYDLYDQPEATAEALEKMVPFFKAHL